MKFNRFKVFLPCFRVTAGYILSLGTMMFIVLCDVQLRLFSDEMSYRVTLAAVGVIALGCTGQSFFYYFNNLGVIALDCTSQYHFSD